MSNTSTDLCPVSISNKASPILVSEFKLSHSITLGELSLSLSLRERWVIQKTIKFGELQSTTCVELRSPSRATESVGTHGLESRHMEKLCWSQQAMFIGQVPAAVTLPVLLRSPASGNITDWLYHVHTSTPPSWGVLQPGTEHDEGMKVHSCETQSSSSRQPWPKDPLGPAKVFSEWSCSWGLFLPKFPPSRPAAWSEGSPAFSSLPFFPS